MSFKTQHIQVDGSINVNGSIYLSGIPLPSDTTSEKVNRSGDTMTGGLLISSGDISIMNGDAYFDRHVHIGGFLQVDGSLIYTNIQSINISTGFLQLSTGITGSPPPTLQSGIVVNRGSEAPYIFAYDEDIETFRIGITQLETSTHYSDASTQAVATRQDSPTSNGVGYWNSSKFRIDTSPGFVYNPASGEVSIGAGLRVATNIYLPVGGNIWIGNSSDSSARTRIHTAGVNSYIDFGDQLFIRGGLTASNFLVNCTSTGMVGIGIGSNPPLKMLHVANPNDATDSAIRLGSGTSKGDLKYNNTEDTLDFINYSTWGSAAPNPAASIRWFTNNDTTTPKMHLHRDGNLGIGTNAPTLTLDVAIPAGGMVLPANTGSTPFGIARLGYNDHSWDGVELNFGIYNNGGGNYNYPAWIQAQAPTNYSVSRPIALNPNGGNVGIGTAAPTYKLHVLGAAVNYGTPTNTIVAENAPSGGTMSNGAYYGSITLRGNTYDWGRISTIQTDPGSSWLNRIAFFGMNGNGGSLTERMCIQNDGAVGIGITTPERMLHMYKSTANGEGPILYLQNSIYADASNATTGIKMGLLSGRYAQSYVIGEGTYGQVHSYRIALTDDSDVFRDRFTVKRNGNVGIGTIDPGSRLSVVGGFSLTDDGTPDSTAVRLFSSAGNLYLQAGTGDNIIFRNKTAAEIGRMNSNGYMSLGTTSCPHPLTLLQNIYPAVALYSDYNYSANRNWAIVTNSFGSGSWGGLAFRTSDAQDGNPLSGSKIPLGIDVNGRVGVGGQTSPSYTLDVSGTVRSTGDMTATNFNLSSDETLKTNIIPIKKESIDIEYKEFELISQPGQKRYGVIAQELQKINPELVRTDPDGLLNVAYIDLLIKEIASLKERVAQLERKTE
jgi:hypothetical protein